MHTRNRKLNEKGQSTIEFIMTLSFALGVSFLFISQSLNSTIGFLVHYATFMGGRTFLSYDSGSNSATNSIDIAANRAVETFNRYTLTRYNISPQINMNKPTGNSSLFSGITAQYERLLTPYKMVGGGSKATYYSEGFLGKEPTRSSCRETTCGAMNLSSCSASMDITLFDNGC